MNITDIAQYLGWGLLAIFVILILVIGFLLFKDRGESTPKPAKEPKQKTEKTPKKTKEQKQSGAETRDDSSMFSTEQSPSPGKFSPQPTRSEGKFVPQFSPTETQVEIPEQNVMPVLEKQAPKIGLPSRPAASPFPQPPVAPKPTPPKPPVPGVGGPPIINRPMPNRLINDPDDNQSKE